MPVLKLSTFTLGNIMLWLLIILLFPLLEISVFINVGSALGAGPVILLTVGTAIWGMAMVRIQGMDTFKKMQQTMARGETPAYEMLEGTMLLIAGFFLLLPGFITDTLGIILLIPPVRRWIAKKNITQSGIYRSRWTSVDFGNQNGQDSQQQNPRRGRTIDQDDDNHE